MHRANVFETPRGRSAWSRAINIINSTQPARRQQDAYLAILLAAMVFVYLGVWLGDWLGGFWSF
ncbi:hypothetical protein COO20_06685 [Thalassospira marina]|uniref:Uncharacterized protein n=2 Tax=Thalassospira marina TaxID=2048283 RepID=A0A2N3KX10_9PROT|nr:hypothetical protein COO20_06685 [Thalassospira marina]